ncbi:hypothetical protein NYR76_02820 [Actinobacillus equuli subsp. equuli]|uniref:hypothetical protein n=1 Tax=Actinobacillus equuli TaxID=718 RepID=UPI002442718A|nr:hypothetical protein [Actinobacillus equuli]WGE65909.1 hypothetical protein NYR76_02820 [Actinobacillus equuli subsp. equuli]
MAENNNLNNTNRENVSLEGYAISDHKTRSLNAAASKRQVLAEGFNLKVANQAPPPRPTTTPVGHKKK